jgi:hypothetical protein
VLGACWPLTMFWEILGHAWPFLGLRQPVEDGAPDKVEIAESRPTFGVPFGFLGICNGKGISAHGFTHAYAHFFNV